MTCQRSKAACRKPWLRVTAAFASAHDVRLVLWARHTGGGVVGAEDGGAPAVASGRGRAAKALQKQCSGPSQTSISQTSLLN